MKTPFKMKDFSGFGNSPMKQNRFNRPPKGFDSKAAKKRALEIAKIPTSGHGTIEDLKAKSLKRKNIVKLASKVKLGPHLINPLALAGMGNPASAKATDKALNKEAKNKLKGLTKTHVPKY